MQGYWNNDKLTDRVLNRKSGWLSTGDLGYVDADGYVHLVGRADDVINTGGVSVIPDDVEKIAMEFGGVEDCGCIGVPDPEGVLGEVPNLFVVSSNTEFDWALFNRHVLNRLGSLVPKVIVKDIDKLPRSDSGKLLRQELRELHAPRQTRT
jgi:long-chain acyl-CoA synthetase